MKILLITPNFFEYPQLITEELTKMGHQVDWFDDRPSTNSFIKAFIRLDKRLVKPIIRRYFNSFMHSTQDKVYDKVILISGQSLSFTEEMINRLKNSQSKADFILYQWDSQSNFSNIVAFQKYFDRCYSFDREDAQENSKLQFLPLFYARKYETIGRISKQKYKYDLMFVGTAHPKKYKYIKEIAQRLKPSLKNQYIYFFFPSRLVFFYRKVRNRELKKSKYSEFNYKALTGKKLDSLLSESWCVIDSPQNGQNGLTIRVIETLGAKRKLITTNRDIKNYDFYCPENIYIYDGNQFDLTKPFFTEPYKEINKTIYQKYSLNSWLKHLLN